MFKYEDDNQVQTEGSDEQNDDLDQKNKNQETAATRICIIELDVNVLPSLKTLRALRPWWKKELENKSYTELDSILSQS